MNGSKATVKQQPKGLVRIIVRFLKLLLLLVLIAAFWLIVIVIRPETKQDNSIPAVSNMPIQQKAFSQESDLFEAIKQTGGHVMAYPYGMGITFVDGEIRHLMTGNNDVQIWSLTYCSANGITVNVQTITPNNAIEALNVEGLRLSSSSQIAVSGVPFARLIGSQRVVYYGQSEEALYRVEMPVDVDENAILQSLQLINSN